MNGLREKACHWFPLLLLIALGDGAWAERVDDLYVAKAPVAGQGAQAREAAIREVFAKVLVKVSGDRDLPAKRAVAGVLADANDYVQQYRYLGLDAATGQAGAADRLLWVRFDTAAVDRLLRSKGIPVWGDTRPATLIWLGMDEQGQRRLFQPESEPALRGALAEVAQERGLPVLFPMMDMEDRANLQVSDVWGRFEETIRHASDRYLPDVILVGALRRRAANDWLADWTLYQPDTMKSWRSRGDSRRAVATQGLHQAVDRLAARFAPQGVAQGGKLLRLRVAGLDHLEDYVLVKDYLASMGDIEQLDLLSADPRVVSFLVRSQGGADALERGIMLGRVMEQVAAPEPPLTEGVTISTEPFDGETLYYRLQR